MVVFSMIYPCNFGCPNCPYTDGNSPIRRFYREQRADRFPVELWNRLAVECGRYGAWMRCTGGGEPMLHPQMTEMIETAKRCGARVWLNTNGSLFGPQPKLREKLRRVLAAGIDLMEFSMDAGDAQAYARVRPPIAGPPKDPERWFENQVGNVRAALRLRKELSPSSRIVVSMIRQELIETKLDDYVRFWSDEVGVDEVITRKFLSWDDNTTIDLERSLDRGLYAALPDERKEPCVWPFERLNVDTLGRVALCGQDIAFRTADRFPNLWDCTIRDVWLGETFQWYRRRHLEGRGAECFPCRGCSAWLAGVRDWNYGWLQVLEKSGDKVRETMKRDLGVDVEVHPPTLRRMDVAPGASTS